MTSLSYIYNKVSGKGAMIVACGLMMAAAFVSCDKLDEVPDNRTEIDSPEKVVQLLASAYPVTSPAVVCELSSDNLVDDNVVVPSTHNAAYQDFNDEAYQWQDIKNYTTNQQDTPYQIWDGYYGGIATCNHAIEAMLEMSKDPANDKNLKAAWGEAHVLRAYMHFVLVNVFAEAYLDEARNTKNMGVPYVTKTENVVKVDYSTSQFLHNIKDTYALIEKDMLEGISCIDDNAYKVPGYHFTKNAANAFAARFYLYTRQYEKCIEYADKALGENPSAMLRKWANINTSTISASLLGYNDETAPCNFLIQSTYSLQDRVLASCRYAVNEGVDFEQNGEKYHVPSTMSVCVWGKGPCWSGSLPAYSSKVLVPSRGQQYGALLFSVYEYFEYTDKIAGIGYVHMLYHPLSAEETLLCRAEAKLYLGYQAGCMQDLGYWKTSKLCTDDLTIDGIKSFYSRSSVNDYVSTLHPAEMGFQTVLTGDDASILDCILHFRRIETLHEGLRWFDIKRYGIEVTHFSRGPMDDDVTITHLSWDDSRRVLQIPQNVLDAGYPSSRPTTGAPATGSGDSYQTVSKLGTGAFSVLK